MVDRVSSLPAAFWGLLIAWLLFWACGCSDSAGNGGQPPGSGYPACGEGTGGDNPQPENISGSPGDARIEVTPLDAPADFDNLQWAVDNVAPGGTVKLCSGTFFVGEGSNRKTVAITRGITIEGVVQEDGIETVIRGGGGFVTDEPRTEAGGALSVANESDQNPNVFQALWLRDWTSEAINISASAGFVLRDSRISHPRAPQSGDRLIVDAIWSSGESARGDFLVENNLVELDDYPGDLPHDEQLIGVFFANHDTIQITGNLVTCHDEAFEVARNGYARTGGELYPDAANRGSTEIIITNNVVNVTQTLPEGWNFSEALLIAGNVNDVVRVEDNLITVRGTRMGHALAISGEGFQVRGNTFSLERYEGTASAGAILIGLGFFFDLVETTLGASLNDSVIENNLFSGSVAGPAIVFGEFVGAGAEPNESHGSVIDVGDSLTTLEAEVGLEIAPMVHDNQFIGDFGTVVDHSMGANEFL